MLKILNPKNLSLYLTLFFSLNHSFALATDSPSLIFVQTKHGYKQIPIREYIISRKSLYSKEAVIRQASSKPAEKPSADLFSINKDKKQ